MINFNNSKKKKMIASVVALLLVGAMVLSLCISFM